MPNPRSKRGARKGQPSAGEMPKNKSRRRRRRPTGFRGGSDRSSQGGKWSSQPLQLGNEIDVGKIPLFPPSYRATLRYSDALTLTSTSGVVASYVFSTNGLFDPDVTGTGHQPAGFDQMMLSYEHYTVLNARITATFHNTSTTTAGTVAISVNAASTPVTVYQQILEDGVVSYCRIGQFGVANAIQTLQRSCNIGRFGGVPNVLDDNNYRGTVAANPAEQSYFILQSWSIEASTVTCSVDFVLEYDAVFTEPRKLTESLRAPLMQALKESVVAEEAKVSRDFSSLALSRPPDDSDPETGPITIVDRDWYPDSDSGLKRPNRIPPRPRVQGGPILQAGGTALIGKSPIVKACAS